MGTYVGIAELLDHDDAKLADVRVTLARADAEGEHWFGAVEGLDDHLELDGQDVIVQLPVGSRGHARVVIDLTGDVPVVRLVGSGPAPV